MATKNGCHTTVTKRKRSWSKAGESFQTVAKPALTAKKVLLCVWWDWKGRIYYELIPHDKTLNSTIYTKSDSTFYKALNKEQQSGREIFDNLIC